MFADIAGSTKLYDTLGDQAARAKVAASIDTMSEITTQNSGTVIKTIGDEVMCTFPTAEDAGTAAWEMQETFDEEAEACTDGSPVALEKGDLDLSFSTASHVGNSPPAGLHRYQLSLPKTLPLLFGRGGGGSPPSWGIHPATAPGLKNPTLADFTTLDRTRRPSPSLL